MPGSVRRMLMELLKRGGARQALHEVIREPDTRGRLPRPNRSQHLHHTPIGRVQV